MNQDEHRLVRDTPDGRGWTVTGTCMALRYRMGRIRKEWTGPPQYELLTRPPRGKRHGYRPPLTEA